jgi:hypothetical protein
MPLERALLESTCLVAHAQTTAAHPSIGYEPETEQSAHEARIRKRRGVHDMDPNGYVCSPECAMRLQLPQQWATKLLKGADAVAGMVSRMRRSEIDRSITYQAYVGTAVNPSMHSHEEIK